MKSSARLRRSIWVWAAVIHFGLRHLVLPLTTALAEQAAGTPGGPGTAITLLVRVTKLLHFPLVTLALYPREWFPGNWVYVPMALNSLIWASGICCLATFFRKGR